MHRDYICGVGVPMYYNWLLFIGFWACTCYLITDMVSHFSQFATIPLYREQCPALGDLSGMQMAPSKNLAMQLAAHAGSASSPYDIRQRMRMLYEGYEQQEPHVRQLRRTHHDEGESVFSKVLDKFSGVSSRNGMFKMLELQRYEFAVHASTASWAITLFTLLSVLVFAWIQKAEERRFDAKNADMGDYCFSVDGLPTGEPLELDEVNRFFLQKCGTKFIGASVAHDFDSLKKLPKNGMTLDEICDKVVARADRGILRSVYEKELALTRAASAVTSSETTKLKITDFVFPWNWLYLQEYFLCFLSPTGKKLQSQYLKAQQETEMVTLHSADGSTTQAPQGRELISKSEEEEVQATASRESDPEMAKYVALGLVAPDFTSEQADEIRDELRQLKCGGVAYCFCDYEDDVDVCVAALQAATKEAASRGNAPAPSSTTTNKSRTWQLLEQSLANWTVRRDHVQPGDILWDSFDSSKTFLQSWVYGPLGFVVQIILYGFLMYAPAVIFMLNSLQDSATVPQGWSMTILGILFSSGNGVVGLMFWYIAVALPFRFRFQQWLVVMVSYSFLFIVNTAFSVYIVFGQVYMGEKAEIRDKDALGEETYLGKQLYELLVPGTFLMPYFIWPLTGYMLRRLLRLYNSFIPFTDDVWSARVMELRKVELHLEPPMIYLAWDYAINFTLPLCCVLMSYLSCPRFTCLLFYNLIIWAVWMYFSQKYLHLMSSKMTFYSSARLSIISFEMFALIIGFLAGSIPYWRQRAAEFAFRVQQKLQEEAGENGASTSGTSDQSAPEGVSALEYVAYFFGAAAFYLFVLEICIRPREVEHAKLDSEADIGEELSQQARNTLLGHTLGGVGGGDAFSSSTEPVFSRKKSRVERGVNFFELEKKLGVNFENVNPVQTLKSHFLKEECQTLLSRREGCSIMPFRPGKQYLHFSYDVDLAAGRLGDMWDITQDMLGTGRNRTEQASRSIYNQVSNTAATIPTGVSGFFRAST
ncbi:unnamed protein product [Amoebophrya sp. A25]|nr:unnamed protein product [Amoebophrya sp. A25]|eukprot:GSA25T00026409001.1